MQAALFSQAGRTRRRAKEAGRQTAVCADRHRTGTKHAGRQGRAWKSWNAGRKVGKPQKSLCMLAKCGRLAGHGMQGVKQDRHGRPGQGSRQAGRQKCQAGKHSKARTQAGCQADQKCRHCKAGC